MYHNKLHLYYIIIYDYKMQYNKPNGTKKIYWGNVSKIINFKRQYLLLVFLYELFDSNFDGKI